MINLLDMQQYISGIYDKINICEMDPKMLIFEERVKLNCYYCGKYNNSWRCPPKMPDLNYKKIMTEFERGIFVYFKFDINDDNFNDIRTQSSVILHKSILNIEKYLWENNEPLCLSFIGGSCKLCKSGCGKEKCNNPYSARSPLEATGVNVIKSAAQYGIDIVFPPKEKLMRIGLVLWQ